MKNYNNYLKEGYKTDQKENQVLIDLVRGYGGDEYIDEEYLEIQNLLEQGVDVNLKNKEGGTSFSVAAMKNHHELVDLMCEYDIKAETISETLFLLMFIVEFIDKEYDNNIKTIFHILEKGLDWYYYKKPQYHYFPHNFKPKDLERFKNEYPEKYKKFIIKRKSSDFNL